MKNLLIILAIVFLLPFATMAQEGDAKTRFYAGIVAEEIEGDLKKAEAIYKELLKNYPDDRQLSAKCLYHLGMLYEKKESKQAMDQYVSLLEKYPDQGDLAELARMRISKLNDANTFVDPRDGHKYKWVKIGNQVWMAENLAYMPHVNPPMKQEYGIWVYEYALEGEYDVAAAKATENYHKYGCLYDWPTAMGLGPEYLEKEWGGNPENWQGLCPPGWRMPSDQDWMKLERFLGMPDSVVATDYHRAGWITVKGKRVELPPVGGYLKSTELWNSDGEGTNASGFNILPAGERWENISTAQSFSGLGYFAGYWTTTEGDSITKSEYGEENDAWFRQFRGKESRYNSKNEIDRMPNPKTVGFSVRCLKSGNNLKTKVNITADKKPENKTQKIIVTPDYSTTIWNQSFGNAGHLGYSSHEIPVNMPQEVISLPTIKDGWSHPVEGQNALYYLMSDTTIGMIQNNESKLFWKSQEKLFPANLVFCDNLLICMLVDNAIIALDTTEKELIWKWSPKEKLASYMATDGKSIVVGSREGVLFSIEIMSGNLNWSFQAPSQILTCPTIANGKVYFTTFRLQTTDHRNRFSYLFALDAATGQKYWTYEFEGSIFSSPTVANDLIFIGGGDYYLYAIDATTGKKRWRFYADDKVWDCPTVSNGQVYIQSHAGYFFAIDISSGKENWRYKFSNIGGGYYHSLASENSVVFGTSESGLIALSTKDGTLLWKFPTKSRSTYNPIMIKNQILFRAGDEIIVIE